MAVTGGACRLGDGIVYVEMEGDLVRRIEFMDGEPWGMVPESIAAYCRGEPVDLSGLRSIALEGSGRSAAIYREVCLIPYGTTTTYGAIARQIGSSPRAVGQAMRRNPTPLVVPCHRVIGADGTLRGFTPSVAIKAFLLALEQGAPNR